MISTTASLVSTENMGNETSAQNAGDEYTIASAQPLKDQKKGAVNDLVSDSNVVQKTPQNESRDPSATDICSEICCSLEFVRFTNTDADTKTTSAADTEPDWIQRRNAKELAEETGEPQSRKLKRNLPKLSYYKV